jgi:hypothetical protein
VNTVRKIEWKIWLPHFIVIAWLIYLGLSIWQHAMHSVQPPLYDPLSYIQKAINFWRAVEQGNFINPLNLEPTVRPPGTILMSYPFGFSYNFHGFHFRSVFFPILCIVAAVYITAGATRIRTECWWVAAIAFLFSSLPLFYFFDLVEENPGPVRWGLVDNFQAGMAAMAAAALVRSLMDRSQSWLLFAALLASFTLLIKPSGLMVMALTALTWIMIIAFEWIRARRLQLEDASLRTYTLKGMCGILIVFIGVSALCVFSGYLSEANFSQAKQALKVMAEVLHIPLRQTLMFFHQSTGEALLIWLIGVSALFIHYLPATKAVYDLLTTRVMGLLVSSLVIFILGIWYWQVIQAGGSQIRYFYPFLMMGVICVIPAALYIWPHANRLSRTLLMAACLLPAVNIGLLLAAGDNPSVTWQKVTGVSVSVGLDREEVSQASTFINELRSKNKNAQLYSFANGIPAAVFENVGMYEGVLDPELPNFHVIIPLDWLRGFAVRTSQMVECDYILVNKSMPADEATELLNAKKIDNFDLESAVFQAWLSTLNEDSGLKVVSEGHKLRLLQVINRMVFERAIDGFVSTRSWRLQFRAENSPVWWAPESVFNYTKNMVANEVKFGDLYKLHAMAINPSDKQIKIEVWWEELKHEENNNHRFMFLHLLDSSGKIVGNQQVAVYPYTPLSADRRWRYGTVIFNQQYPIDKSASLAFGIYQPPGEFLLPDKGIRDWDGRRVVIPLNPSTGTQLSAIKQH